MSFYTIDGRFVNKKNVVEGFFDNRVIEHATIGIDNQDTPNESTEEITTLENSMSTENATAMEATATNESTEEITTLENSMPTENATSVNEIAEIPMTNEMKEDKSLHMHFCINGKCLTGNELRKLNELYDKKCTN